MFEFIKKIFTKEEVLEEVKFSDLDSWLTRKVFPLDFNPIVKEYFNQLEEQKKKWEKKILDLEKVPMGKKDKERVAPRIQNIVMGHKNNYLREMKWFLRDLALPGEKDLISAIEFNDSLNQRLDQLAKNTVKSYQAAQHLFFEPVEAVFKTVGEINLLVKNFNKELEKRNLERISELESQVKLLGEGQDKKEKLVQELNGKEIHLKNFQKEKEEQEKELQALKESSEYQEFNSLEEEKNNLNSQIKAAQDEITLFFSQLGRALRKYEKVTMEIKIVRAYLEDAAGTFFKDSELKILGVLEGIKGSLEKGMIVLDEKQGKKTLSLIEKAKGGYFREILERENKLEKEIEKIKEELVKYKIIQTITEQENEIKQTQEKINLLLKERGDLNSKLEHSQKQIKQLETEFKDLVKEVLKVELTIK